MTPDPDGSRLFAAEANYAQSLVMSALGDVDACVESLECALEVLPTYAPALLALASIDYQLGDREQGRRRLREVLELPDDADNLAGLVDLAGDFLIDLELYGDGLELYRAAATRWPEVAVLHQGLSCCAGHEGLHEVAIAAARTALELQPDDPDLVNDLGWCLFESGDPEGAVPLLERAVAMESGHALATENLRICREALHERVA